MSAGGGSAELGLGETGQTEVLFWSTLPAAEIGFAKKVSGVGFFAKMNSNIAFSNKKSLKLIKADYFDQQTRW